LCELRKDQLHIASELKLADLHLLTLYEVLRPAHACSGDGIPAVLLQEYSLLLRLESRDVALQQKQLQCDEEKAELQQAPAIVSPDCNRST
jgi:hypothetical protein